MAQVLPQDRRLMVQFGTNHELIFDANAASIGLTAAQATEFKNATSDAEAALAAVEAARLASKAATTAYYGAVTALRTIASACVRDIKAFAEVQADPMAVYALAAIPAPDPRSATGTPPAQPTDLRASVESNGALTIAWKCANPQGVSRVVYVVQRKLAGETNFSVAGFTGEKSYVDNTLPIGLDGVTYIVTGQAGGLAGPASSQFAVTFGTVPGGGTFVASSSSNGGVKLAA